MISTREIGAIGSEAHRAKVDEMAQSKDPGVAVYGRFLQAGIVEKIEEFMLAEAAKGCDTEAMNVAVTAFVASMLGSHVVATANPGRGDDVLFELLARVHHLAQKHVDMANGKGAGHA